MQTVSNDGMCHSVGRECDAHQIILMGVLLSCFGPWLPLSEHFSNGRADVSWPSKKSCSCKIDMARFLRGAANMPQEQATHKIPNANSHFQQCTLTADYISAQCGSAHGEKIQRHASCCPRSCTPWLAGLSRPLQRLQARLYRCSCTTPSLLSPTLAARLGWDADSLDGVAERELKSGLGIGSRQNHDYF